MGALNSMKFYEIIKKFNGVHVSYSNKYSEIKMCDLEPFSEIRSHILMNKTSIVECFISISTCATNKMCMIIIKQAIWCII